MVLKNCQRDVFEDPESVSTASPRPKRPAPHGPATQALNVQSAHDRVAFFGTSAILLVFCFFATLFLSPFFESCRVGDCQQTHTSYITTCAMTWVSRKLPQGRECLVSTPQSTSFKPPPGELAFSTGLFQQQCFARSSAHSSVPTPPQLRDSVRRPDGEGSRALTSVEAGRLCMARRVVRSRCLHLLNFRPPPLPHPPPPVRATGVLSES